jgi:hypothetical protein
MANALMLLATNYASDDDECDDYGTQWWVCDDLLEMIGKRVITIRTPFYWEEIRIDALSSWIGINRPQVLLNDQIEEMGEQIMNVLK